GSIAAGKLMQILARSEHRGCLVASMMLPYDSAIMSDWIERTPSFLWLEL
ncbi:hypothetical protein PSYPI_41443, partial [Pseudomonas syringae pv. pisi str. 1704B]